MKDEFDIENLQKKMPYQVPSGFFEGITQATLQEAKRREPEIVKIKQTIGWQVWSIAASIVLLLVTGYFLLSNTQSAAPVLTKVEEAKDSPFLAPDTASIVPETGVTAQEKPQPATLEKPTPEVRRNPERKPVPGAVAKAEKPESLDKLLATLTDEELAELAAMADTESYVYEESLQ